MCTLCDLRAYGYGAFGVVFNLDVSAETASGNHHVTMEQLLGE
jgi:hypothetical protein